MIAKIQAQEVQADDVLCYRGKPFFQVVEVQIDKNPDFRVFIGITLAKRECRRWGGNHRHSYVEIKRALASESTKDAG